MAFQSCADKCIAVIESNRDDPIPALEKLVDDKDFALKNVDEMHMVIDYAFRRVLEKRFLSQVFSGQNLLEKSAIFDLMEIASSLPSTLLDVNMPFNLISDTCDACTVDQIDEVISFLEKENTNIYRHVANNVKVTASYLNLLSTCKVIHS